MKLIEIQRKINELVENGYGNYYVIASSDAEGNGFNTVSEFSVEKCYENEPVHPDDIEDNYYDENDLSEKVVIWT